MGWIIALMLVAGGNRTIESFEAAKELGAWLHAETFYCGCPLLAVGEATLRFDPEPCGYRARRPSARSKRVEWEHVVPASRLGSMFTSHRDGHRDCVQKDGRAYRGRRCALRVSPRYRRILADLYNLRPAIGELNQDRSDYPPARIPGEARAYGACDFEVHGSTVEPPEHRMGDVARTYIYMDLEYGPFLTDQERVLFARWNLLDPVDAAECLWARSVAVEQGNRNNVVEQRCAERGL
jgi:deoxyribonuclease-1